MWQAAMLSPLICICVTAGTVKSNASAVPRWQRRRQPYCASRSGAAPHSPLQRPLPRRSVLAMEPSSSSDLGGDTRFWKTVPVLLRRQERAQERVAQLNIRLIDSGRQQGQRVRSVACSGISALDQPPRAIDCCCAQVLRIFVSSESDLFFLHVLEVGEEEYALLRHEQDIRVDFANFAGKLIGLLEECIACKDEDLPRCGKQRATLRVGWRHRRRANGSLWGTPLLSCIPMQCGGMWCL